MTIRNALPFEFPYRWPDLRRFFGKVSDEAVDLLDQRDRDLEDFLANLRSSILVPQIAAFYSDGGTFPTSAGAALGVAALNGFYRQFGPDWAFADAGTGYDAASAMGLLSWMSPPQGAGLCRLASGLYEVNVLLNTPVTTNANHEKAEFKFEQSASTPAWNLYVTQGTWEYHGILAFDEDIDADFDMRVVFSALDGVVTGNMDWVANPSIELTLRPVTLLTRPT